LVSINFADSGIGCVWNIFDIKVFTIMEILAFIFALMIISLAWLISITVGLDDKYVYRSRE
jgi:hypothetical protein